MEDLKSVKLYFACDYCGYPKGEKPFATISPNKHTCKTCLDEMDIWKK